MQGGSDFFNRSVYMIHEDSLLMLRMSAGPHILCLRKRIEKIQDKAADGFLYSLLFFSFQGKERGSAARRIGFFQPQCIYDT
jgi:hypothetical protein